MIPKKIHYCWFGRGKKPVSALNCIESWIKYCPDYEIVEWNEDNFNTNLNAYTKFCYENRKFAFLSDYVRLLVINQHGGIYLDTDVELVNSLGHLLDNKAYIGFETKEYVATGLGFGSIPNSKMVELMLLEYDAILEGTKGITGCPILNTSALVKLGMIRNGEYQNLTEATVYPIDYFNPYDVSTGWLKKTNNTVSIHWYSASWMNKCSHIRLKITKPFHRIKKKLFGNKLID